MAVSHISQADAARDFTAIMARVRAGDEIVIEVDATLVAVLRPVSESRVRLLSESLQILKERGSTVTLDGDFGRDLEQIVDSRHDPLNPPAWD